MLFWSAELEGGSKPRLLRRYRGISRCNGPVVELVPQDVVLHGHLGPAHSIGLSFVERLLVVPVIVGDPVAGEDRAGAVGAPAAMHEYRTGGLVIQQLEQLRHLLFGGSGV